MSAMYTFHLKMKIMIYKFKYYLFILIIGFFFTLTKQYATKILLIF